MGPELVGNSTVRDFWFDALLTITDDKGQQPHCWQGDGDQRCGLREFEIKDFWTLLAAHVMLVFLSIK